MSVLYDLYAKFADTLAEKVEAALEENAFPIGDIMRFASTPVEFEFGATFTAYFQGVALFIAAMIIVVNGLTKGYLLNGGTQEMSTGAYIWRSIWPIALIAAAPTIVSTLNSLIRSFIADLLPASAGSANELLIALKLMGMAFLPGGPALGLVLTVVFLYYWITVCFQVAKRMVQLSVLSTIMPLLAGLTAADPTSGDFLTIVKEMVGIGIITVLQVSAYMGALAFFLSLATPTPVDVFLFLALLSSVKQLPSWIQRYTLAPVVSRGDSAFQTVRNYAQRAGSAGYKRFIAPLMRLGR